MHDPRRQLSLFDAAPAEPPPPLEAVRFDPAFAGAERHELAHGAWVELVRGWVRPGAPLFARLERCVRWRQEERPMYGRMVMTPRLYAVLERERRELPVLEEMRAALSTRYREELVRISAALYRDGGDSVAMHGDTTARDMIAPTHVATLSLGGTRRMVMKPTDGGAAIELALRDGDLCVMGGTAQRTWRHGIPKVKSAEPRIVVMFRPRWGEE